MIGIIKGSRDYQANMMVLCNMQCHYFGGRPLDGRPRAGLVFFAGCRVPETNAMSLRILSQARISMAAYQVQTARNASAYLVQLPSSIIITMSRIMKLQESDERKIDLQYCLERFISYLIRTSGGYDVGDNH
jgi:hypothetical protein